MSISRPALGSAHIINRFARRERKPVHEGHKFPLLTRWQRDESPVSVFGLFIGWRVYPEGFTRLIHDDDGGSIYAYTEFERIGEVEIWQFALDARKNPVYAFPLDVSPAAPIFPPTLGIDDAWALMNIDIFAATIELIEPTGKRYDVSLKRAWNTIAIALSKGERLSDDTTTRWNWASLWNMYGRD